MMSEVIGPLTDDAGREVGIFHGEASRLPPEKQPFAVMTALSEIGGGSRLAGRDRSP